MEESNEHRGERALGGLAGGAVAARATKAAIATVETKATAEVSVAGLLTVPLFLGLDGIKRFSPASVAERLGADCHGAKQRAKRNFHKVACMMRAPSAGGPQKVLAIDLKYLPAFMLGFGCNQVRKEIGPRLDEIQEAMHTALSAYTFEGVGAHPHVAPARDPHPLFPRDDASGEQRDLGARGRPCGSFAPHPLFPRADKSPEDRDIKFVSFKRHDATGVVVSQCEEIPASEVTSWEQVFAWWGGGRYKAYGKDGMHRFQAQFPAGPEWYVVEGPSRPLIPRDYVPEVAAPEVAGASDLAPVRVGDWIVFSADEDFWIRDLELAERAGLTQPRNIRPIIRKAIDLGALTVLPRGACEARPTGIGSARAACATNGAVVRVETVVLPKGNHGGTQEADEFYLNEEAALFIVTRLRAKAAIRLTQSVIRVFVLVRRGELVAPSPALTRADFEALTGKFLSVVSAAPVPFARTVAELQQGMERLVRHHGDLAALVEQARAERLPPRRKDVERMVRFIAREEVALANRSLRPDHDLPPDQDPHPRNARTKR